MRRLMFFAAFLLAAAMVGCAAESAVPREKRGAKPASKKAALGKNVYLEIEGDRRRVLVDAQVCLREGGLEQFLTRNRIKEHEAVLTFEGDARHIHAALIAAGAEPGKPVQFRPKYQPASGTPIKVSVRYEVKGKTVEMPAQKWIRNFKTGKDLEYDWVFAGSFLIPDPLDKTKPPFYAANDGDVICISNFHTAMLDLPIPSSADDGGLFYEAHAERIPPLGTRVWVILEPVKKR